MESSESLLSSTSSETISTKSPLLGELTSQSSEVSSDTKGVEYYKNISVKNGIQVDSLSDQEIRLMENLWESDRESRQEEKFTNEVAMIRRDRAKCASDLILPDSREGFKVYFKKLNESDSANFIAQSILTLHEAATLGLTSEEAGARLDMFLSMLHSSSPILTLNENQIAGLASVLRQFEQENSLGFPSSIRRDMILQSLQFLSLSKLKYTYALSEDRESEMVYPYDADTRVLGEITKDTKQEDAFVRIMALVSPYKSSLGKSNLGNENLKVYKEMLNAVKAKLDFLQEGSDLRQFAEEALFIQMFHVYGDSFESIINDFSSTTRENCGEYLEYRKIHPLWQDRLSVYKKIWDSSVDQRDEEPSDPKWRIGLSTKALTAINILNEGDYISLHEVFTGNGCTSLEIRSRGEHRAHMLATGTPDDPYLVYGSVRRMTQEQFRDVHQYGNYVFILKPDCFNRSSVCMDDSLDFYGILPFTGYSNFKTFAQQTTAYAEVQVHGGVKLKDVESLVVHESDLEDPICERIIDLCREKGIGVIIKEQMEPESDPNISIPKMYY